MLARFGAVGRGTLEDAAKLSQCRWTERRQVGADIGVLVGPFRSDHAAEDRRTSSPWGDSGRRSSARNCRDDADLDDRVSVEQLGDANRTPCGERFLRDELAMDLEHRVDVAAEVNVIAGHRDDVVPAGASATPSTSLISSYARRICARGPSAAALDARASRDEQKAPDPHTGRKTRFPVPLELLPPRRFDSFPLHVLRTYKTRHPARPSSRYSRMPHAEAPPRLPSGKK